jgi:uncharacterized damage-inducible protein DinB
LKAKHFRQLYGYHFALNRKIWDRCIGGLTEELFKIKLDYSTGSIRNQTVHIMNVDNSWFYGLRGLDAPGYVNPVYLSTKEAVRSRWDEVASDMQAYLAGLTDDELCRPFEKDLEVWQVLFHVLNHGTDHRAQMLAMLNQLGVETFPQDYALFLFGKI